MEPVDVAALSPAILAYLGDALYESIVRRYLILEQGIRKTHRLHREAVKLVKAESQARMARLVEPELAPDELEILRRGRNHKTGHVPPNVSPVVYRHSTGWESLVGYLYLMGREERMESLIRQGIARLSASEGEILHG